MVALVAGAALAGPAAAATPAEHRMVDEVNSVRAGHGLASLRGASSLHRSAGRYARWMLRHDYFGHLQRIRVEPRFGYAGENLAWHSDLRPRVAWTVRAWLGSPGHRALLLSPRYRWVGAGLARGRLSGTAGTAWVLHLGG